MAEAPEPTWVAETHVIWVMPDGVRCPGRIAVGLPTRRPTGEFACAIIADTWSARTFTISGVDSMQALMLGLTFLGYELERFVSEGGRALYPATDDEDSDAEFDLALLMGPLLRAPPPANDPR